MTQRKMSATVRRLRKAKNLTQEELAKKARVTQGYVAQIEAGSIKELGGKVALRLADALGVPVTELLESAKRMTKDETRHMDNNQEIARRLLEQAFELWVGPEIERRQAAGLLPDGFVPFAAQIIMNVDASTAVRLNEELSGRLRVKTISAIDKGDIVRFNDILEIESMELSARDPNAAHITLISHRDRWWIGFDFHYNAARTADVLDVALEFLETAQEALRAGRLRAFADTFFSALELLAKTWLLRFPYRGYLEYLGGVHHGTVKNEFNEMSEKTKHVDDEYLTVFNRFNKIRDKARYSIAPIPITTDSAERDLGIALSFLAHLRETLPPRRKPDTQV